MATFDLDAFRKDRSAAKRKTFILGGKEYSVPGRFPLAVVLDMDEKELAVGLKRWLGSQYDSFKEAGLDQEDLDALLKGLYRADSGESQPSES